LLTSASTFHNYSIISGTIEQHIKSSNNLPARGVLQEPLKIPQLATKPFLLNFMPRTTNLRFCRR
jgi:hypothetical protein